MPSRASKKTILDELEDTNTLAANIVAKTTGQNTPQAVKNPAAVALGRLGASKGGKARAQSLSKKRRRQIARLAASARWNTESEE